MRDSSIPDVVGHQLGNGFKQFMRLFSIVLLLLVGVVFVLGPAKLLGNMTHLPVAAWVAIIFAYYFLATVLPIDQIIGRIYPLFGAVLIFMAVGLTTALIAKGYHFYPQLTLANLHPKGLPLWPLMFITIACGAVSGFHATQSPMMARCMANEKYGRPVFYGAMIGEGVIALIWATLGMSFYNGSAALGAALGQGGPAYVVNQISTTLLGPVGGLLAIIGVVILPITSGDTAFRSARLIIADFLNMPQKATFKRLLLALPLFAVGFFVSQRKLQRHLALLRLGQPDPGDHRLVGRGRLPDPPGQAALDCHRPGHFHDRRGDDLPRLRQDRFQSAAASFHSYRHRGRCGESDPFPRQVPRCGRRGRGGARSRGGLRLRCDFSS